MSAGSSVRGAVGRRSTIGDEGVVEAWWCSWARRFRTRVWRGVGDDVEGERVAADDDDEDAAAVEAKSARGDAAEWGVRGEGIECRRSGMMGRQFEEVERRSLRVVRQDFCTFNMDDASSS